MDSPFLIRPNTSDLDGTLELADLSLETDTSTDSPLRSRAQQHPLGLPPPGASLASGGQQPPGPSKSRQPQHQAAQSQSQARGLATSTRPVRPRFSLFAPGKGPRDEDDDDDDGHDERNREQEAFGSGSGSGSAHAWGEQEQPRGVETEDARAQAPEDAETQGTTRTRDERLRESLAELRGVNAVFERFFVALEDARGHQDRLAARAKETSALLDAYVAHLGQAHHTEQIILNPKWTGVQDDAAALAAAEAHRAELERQAEERADAARREAEEREAAEAARREEERARAERADTTRTRGRGRGGSGIARGRTGTGSTGLPSRTTRPTSGSGIRKPSAVGARWANVQSSGYGPRPRGS